MQKSNVDQAFSSIDFVGQCLVDWERTKAFQRAIKQTIKKNDLVLDLGTGSGIMALTAAASGARKVHAVEYDKFVGSIAKAISSINQKVGRKIQIHLNDARTISFPKHLKFDVVTSEMLTTAMVDEHQVAAINNLHKKKLVDENTRFIPERHDTYVALASANYTWFGLQTPMVLHLWRWHNWSPLKLKLFSKSKLLSSISFKKINPESFNETMKLVANKSGVMNALYITSISGLAGALSVGDTEALNAPMLIPMPPKRVKKGQLVDVKIAYQFGGGYQNFRATVV